MPECKECRVCGSENLEPAVDFGFQPWCNNFLRKEETGREEFYPLCLVYCHRCSTVQLNFTVPKEIMFKEHTYLSGITKTLNNHFQKVAYEINEEFFRDTGDKSVLDIGSNDGTQLKYYKKLGFDVLGVESAGKIADFANKAGIETVNAFFNLDLSRKLQRKFSVINASGVFFHLEELHSVTEGIRESLSDNGVFVVQFLYMKRIVQNTAFDQVYHEHLLYYNLYTLETLLLRHGLSLFDAYVSPVHGGSVIGYAGHKGKREKSHRLKNLLAAEKKDRSNEFETYTSFSKAIQKLKEKNLAYLDDMKKRKKTIYGFGAPAKGNTLLNYFKIGTQYLDCLVEKNPLRKGLFSPGMHIPVIMEDKIEKFPDVYYVLAWNFRKEILENNKNLIDRGVGFYFPVNPQET